MNIYDGPEPAREKKCSARPREEQRKFCVVMFGLKAQQPKEAKKPNSLYALVIANGP
jgi:hypothetical protein